jgi:shikimate dehydrogenase
MSDQYAVIGNPIGHTKSPLIHRLFAEATGQDLVYAAIEGRPGRFADDVEAFRAAGGRGMNVTAPFKLDAFAFATDRSPRARLAGAANALKFDGERVLAENFDGVGLARDVVRNLGIGLRGRRVLLLGAGGAARGALLPFLEQGPAGRTDRCAAVATPIWTASASTWCSTPRRPACAASCPLCRPRSLRPGRWPMNWPTARA